MVGSNAVSTRFKANDLQHAKPLSQSLSGPIGSFEVSQANRWMKWVSQHVLPSSLAVPQQDLLRPRAHWRPQLWAQCWTPCCSYGSAWCCRRCRRILSGKAGREICAKTQRQATLYGWTHTSRRQRAASTDVINRKTDREANKDRNHTVRQQSIEVIYLILLSKWTLRLSWETATINDITSVGANGKINATTLF